MTRNLFRPLILAGVLGGLLTGCGITEIFDDEEKLEGDRIRLRESRTAGEDRPTEAADALPAPQLNPDWTQTNGQSTHASGHLAGPAAPTRVWSADVGTGGEITSAPIVVGGRIFAMDASARVSAFDASSGNSVWRSELTPEGEDGDDGYGGGLAADGGLIFATTGFGEVLAIEPGGGQIVWRYKAQAPFRSAPAAAGGMVIAVTRENEAVALNAADGQLLWRVAGVASAAGSLGGASPAIAGDLAVIPYGSGEIVGVQRSTGRQVWSAVLGGTRRGLARGSISDVTGDPVIAGRIVVAANQSGRMVALDGTTGRRGWTRTLGSTGPLWAAGRSLFLVTDAAQVVRVSLANGKTIWSTQLPAFDDPEDKTDAIAYSGPVLAGGRLFVTDGDGNLLSFDPMTGEQGPTVDLSGGSTTGPVVAGGTLYVLSDNGVLQAFR